MPTAHRFRSVEALQAALTSGLVPESMASSPATTYRHGGTVWVEPRVTDLAVGEQLAAAGAPEVAIPPKVVAVQIRCWAQAIPPKSVKVGPSSNPTLFWLPSEDLLLDTAGELMRLGCNAATYAAVPGGFLLRAVGAPYYTVLRATAPASAIQAYRQVSANVWVGVGLEHPLARALTIDGATILLGREWNVFQHDLEWVDFTKLVRLVHAGTETTVPTNQPTKQVDVPLRVAPGPRAAPELWVLRGAHAQQDIADLLTVLPQHVITGLLFAVAEIDGEDIVVLRKRQGLGSGEISVQGEVYIRHATVPNLMLPQETRLDPPLLQTKVRELLAPDATDLVWLRRGEQPRDFVPESIKESALAPLSDWVRYVIAQRKVELHNWEAATIFDLEDVVLEVAEFRPPKPSKPAPAKKIRQAKRRAQAENASPRALKKNTLNAEQKHLSELQQTYLALELPAEAPERTELLLSMAQTLGTLGEGADAEECLLRAAWVDEDALRQYSESGAGVTANMWKELFVGVKAAPNKAPSFADIRKRWLHQVALAQISPDGGIGLARLRDRLLRQLHNGLTLAQVPRFLRSWGAARATKQQRRIAELITELVAQTYTSKRKHTQVEAPVHFSHGYMQLALAYGLSRIGLAQDSQAVLASGVSEIDEVQGLHAALQRSYHEACDGQAIGLPLDLIPFDAYKYAHIRSTSSVLRPSMETFLKDEDGVVTYGSSPVALHRAGGVDLRGEVFSVIEGEEETAELERVWAGVPAMMAGPEHTIDTARLISGVLDYLHRLPQDRAVPILGQVAGYVERQQDGVLPIAAALAQKALLLAAHFGQPHLVAELTQSYATVLRATPERLLSSVTVRFIETVQALHRFSLNAEAHVLIEAVAKATDRDGIMALRTDGARCVLEVESTIAATFEAAIRLLEGTPPPGKFLRVVRDMTSAVAPLELEQRHELLRALVQRTASRATDLLSTNSHLCVTLVHFYEAVMMAYVGGGYGTHPQTQRMLNEEEFLIRRRIHSDTRRFT